MKQYEPVYFDLRPFPDVESQPIVPRRYFFDFGDGTNTLSDEQIVSHVYTGFGTYRVRIVETDTWENLTSGGTIMVFAEKVVYVYPNDYPLSFEISNAETGQNSSLSPYLVLDRVISVWELVLIDHTDRTLDSSLTRRLYDVQGNVTVSSTNSNILLSCTYDETKGKFLLEITCLAPRAVTFDLIISTDCSTGIVRMAYAQFSFSALLGKPFEKQSEVKALTKTAHIPHCVDAMVGIDSEGNLLFSGNCFYDFSYLGSTNVVDVAASTTAVYYLKDGKLYGRKLDDIEQEGLLLSESGTLFSAPPSNFLNPDYQDSSASTPYDAGGVAFFVNTAKEIYLLENMVATKITDKVKAAQPSYDVNTNVLLATCYLDDRVLYLVTYKDRKIVSLILDLAGRTESKAIVVASDTDEPMMVFQSDITKQTVYCFDDHVSLAENPKSPVKPLMNISEAIAGYACSIARDGVILWTENGSVIVISPEYQMSTQLVSLDNTTFTLMYDSTDQLILHVAEPYQRSACIPMDSLLKVVTLDVSNGQQFCVTQDQGEYLSCGLCSPDTYSIVSEDLNLGHLALYGEQAECSFGPIGSDCEIINYGRVIRMYTATATLSGSTITVSGGDFPGFNDDYVGMEISLTDIGVLAFIVSVESTGKVTVAKVSGERTSGTVTTFRLFDFRSQISTTYNVKMTFHRTGSEQFATIDPNANFEFDCSMVGKSITSGKYKLVIVRIRDKRTAILAPSVRSPSLPKDGETTSQFSIAYDEDYTIIDPILTKPWTLQYQDCVDVAIPELMNIISVKPEQTTLTHSFNISMATRYAVRTLSNDDVAVYVTSTPYNATFTINFNQLSFGMTQFVSTIPTYSPKCQHLFTFGLTKYCSAGQRFVVSVTSQEDVIPYVNYRAPSVPDGLSVSVSPYVYNVVPEQWNTKNNLKDKLKKSKGIAKLNMCASATKVDECKCSATSDIFKNPSESDCIRTARRVRMGQQQPISFVLEEFVFDHWEVSTEVREVTVEEVNNRTDLCANSKCHLSKFTLVSGDYVTFAGPELYHLKLTAHAGNCIQTSYLVFWSEVTNLKMPIFYLSSGAFFILFLLILQIEFVICTFVSRSKKEQSFNYRGNDDKGEKPNEDDGATTTPAGAANVSGEDQGHDDKGENREDEYEEEYEEEEEYTQDESDHGRTEQRR